MSRKGSKTKSPPGDVVLDRIQAEPGIWCLVVRDAATREARQAFLDYCSHKEIPLGPKATLTKKGYIRCPHHDVCFDCVEGAVADDNGKKLPVGLIPVPFELVRDRDPELSDPEDLEDSRDKATLMLTITPAHREYLRKQLQKLDKSHKSDLKTSRKEQNHAGDINQTNE
ncbi:MAG: Rieske 2Fe-2S domain-containing protein [Cytophagales bacterium]|nr:Rieske 2Fe-2S domain-containing protein [Armatimonadota bacterium]